jgi:acyl-CoA synthetase (AMP-forming)/AMP-acid ligase II
MRPDKCFHARSLVRRWGLTPAAAYGLTAIRDPDRVAIIDERGPLTFAEVHRRTDALAHAFRSTAIDHRDTVAIMCRNHRGFIEATVACSKLGANVLYLDPAATPSTIAEIVGREDPHALIYDEEFSELLRPVGDHRRRFVAWCDAGHHAPDPSLEDLIAREGLVTLEPPGEGRSTVMLACHRPAESNNCMGPRLINSLMTPGAAVSSMPLRPREVTLVAAPMFGAWGFLHLVLGMRLASTLVLRRVFDPVEVMAAVDEYDVAALAVLPEMLERIMGLPEAMVSCQSDRLRVIAVPGPELRSDVALPAVERFGDVLHSLRGPTVVQLVGDWVGQTRGAAVAQARVAGDRWLSRGASGDFVARRGTQR